MRLRHLVSALECKHGLADDHVVQAHSQLTILDLLQERGRSGRVIGVVLAQVAQQNIGIEERERHYCSIRSKTSSAHACSAAVRSSCALKSGPGLRKMPA